MTDLSCSIMREMEGFLFYIFPFLPRLNEPFLLFGDFNSEEKKGKKNHMPRKFRLLLLDKILFPKKK